MHLAANGYTLLLHGFQQGGLSLGRNAIDLVSQHNMSENGTTLKLEDLSPKRIIGEHVGAGDVCRHKIRRKLYTRETKTQDLTEASHHERFSQPRHPLQQTVTAANQRDENLFDERFVTHDDARHLRFQIIERMTSALHSRFDFCHRFHELKSPLDIETPN